MNVGPTQHVVVYDKPGQRGIVYDTAYTEAQIQSARIRCINAERALQPLPLVRRPMTRAEFVANKRGPLIVSQPHSRQPVRRVRRHRENICLSLLVIGCIAGIVVIGRLG